MSRSYRRIACEEAFTFLPVNAATRAVDPRVHFGKLDAVARDLGSARVAAMDAAGIDVQLLSLAAPGVQLLAAAEAVALARETNDHLATAVRLHPDRFAALATITPQDPVAASAELERAVGTLGMKGALINSHTANRYLDEAFFWPIFEAAEALDVPIYIHPRDPSEPMRSVVLIPAFLSWAFSVEVGTHALRLIASGVFDRFPKLRIVIGHMGEAIPFLLRRIEDRYTAGIRAGMYKAGFERSPSEYFRDNFAITTSGMNYAAPLRASIDELGIDNILFAADYPFEDQAQAVLQMEGINMTDQERRKIFQINAERVFSL